MSAGAFGLNAFIQAVLQSEIKEKTLSRQILKRYIAFPARILKFVITALLKHGVL